MNTHTEPVSAMSTLATETGLATIREVTPPSNTDWRQHKNEALLEGAKELMLLNGGGAVALLAFAQALWTNGATGLVDWCAVGIVLFALGGLSGAVMKLTRYLGEFHPRRLTPKRNPWWWATISLSVASAFFFVAGALVPAIGLMRLT